jgi:FkbM family methyltransferase
MKSMTLRTTTRDGFTISFINEEEFEAIWWEIFRKKIYFFPCKTDTPFIIDCGANIGLSVLYFKRCFPHARIIAFEPNPQTFQILEQNIRQNHLQGVQLVQAAVAATDGEIQFYVGRDPRELSLGDTGLRGAIVGPEQERRPISVPAVRLSSYITRPIDYLKMDIEGMEETVLQEIAEKLPLITEVRLEFHHSSANEANSLDRMLALLDQYNFKYALESAWRAISINEAKRIMKNTDYHQFMVCIHRNYRCVWWQSWFMNKIFRIQNKVRRGV